MSNAVRKPEYKRKKPLQEISFAGRKPQADTARRQPAAPVPLKAPSPQYREIFGLFKPHMRSTGEDMLIIRAFMHRRGFKEIPEHFTIPQFASAMQWSLQPRHAWVHFLWYEVMDARKFLSAWASALLPQLVEV